MFRDELTPEQVKQIVAELDAIHATYKQPESWRVVEIEQFYELTEEVYNVRYVNNVSTVFARDSRDGRLHQSGSLSYYAPNFERLAKRGDPNQ